jgi:Flp pilus assembly protein TadB
MVARGVPWAVAVVGVQWVLRALWRPGERRARTELAELRRTGRLPSRADPVELQSYLQEERGRMRTGGWVLLVAAAALALLVAVAAATVNDNSPAVWAVAAFSAVLGVAGFRWQRGELARTDALLRELSRVSR